MAFLYKRFRRVGRRRVLASPFWHVEHRDPAQVTLTATGRVVPVRQATAFRIENVRETAQARELEAELTLRERKTHTPRDRSEWKFWVVPYLEGIVSGTSRERYLDAWRMLELWLDEHDIRFPAQVNYPLCAGYVAWREQPDEEQRKFRVRRTTANYEFKLFRQLMKHAVRCGFCPTNPAREVELKRLKDQPRILKPDLTDAQLRDVWAAFDALAEPRRTCFRRAFAIALLHGVRANETNVNPQTDLRLADDPPAIKFFQKGGRTRWKPLHPQLRDFFTRRRAAGATDTFPLARDADGNLMWNTAWHNFFTHKPAGETPFKKREGLEHICFHSLRVTVENTLREAGIPKEVREMYLTHEHETQDDINAAYDRVKLREMIVCHAPLARDWLEL